MKWEYRTVVMPVRGMLRLRITQRDLDLTLNKMGEEGWELVTSLISPARTTRMVMIFKRHAA